MRRVSNHGRLGPAPWARAGQRGDGVDEIHRGDDRGGGRAVRTRLGALVVAALVAAPGIAASQTQARLTLRGLAGQTRTLTAADLARMTRRDTTVSSHNVSGRYAGVPMSDLLRLVGAPMGDSLRGQALVTYVLVEAAD